MQITPKIHILKHDFEISFGPNQKVPRFVYSIIIFGKEITLIDSGVKTSWPAIFDYITKQGRDTKEIRRLILSHSHPDDLGSAAKIKELTHCEIFAHKDEQEWFENIEIQMKQRPVPGFLDLVDHSVTIDHFIEHDQLIHLDNDLTIKVIHSPGHSKGSVNLLFIEDKILFTADSIPLKNDIPNYDNYEELKYSLTQIKNNINYDTLLSSWFPPLNDKKEIELLIEEGEKYLRLLDVSVKINYTGGIEKPLEHCSRVVNDLGLPAFYVNPIVDKAFRTHLD